MGDRAEGWHRGGCTYFTHSRCLKPLTLTFLQRGDGCTHAISYMAVVLRPWPSRAGLEGWGEGGGADGDGEGILSLGNILRQFVFGAFGATSDKRRAGESRNIVPRSSQSIGLHYIGSLNTMDGLLCYGGGHPGHTVQHQAGKYRYQIRQTSILFVCYFSFSG